MSPYSPERAKAFEAGLRTEWLEHRLRVNITGFWNNYSDLQVGAFRPVTGGTGQQAFIANSAFEEARGAEFEVTALPIRGLRLNASVGFLDAHYTSFNAALSYNFPGHVCNGLTAGAGSPPIVQNHADPSTPCFLVPPLSPKLTATLDASYDIDMGDHGSLTPHISWSTESSYFTNLTNAPQGFQRGWSELNANLTYQDPTGRWRLSVFGKNLTNTVHLLNSNPIAGLFTVNYYADPRVFGVELGVKFR
jgi:iron complex outermembrane receptor protein